MTNVWISAIGLCGATVLGSILGFFIKKIPHEWNDIILGFCAGIMLAASTIGLIVPAFEQTDYWWIVAAGVILGAIFLNVLDLVTPHIHSITGLDPEEHATNTDIDHVLLFILAIAIHKLPEGMAAGVSLCAPIDGKPDWGVSIGIALQNIPEGMVIIIPLLLAGVSYIRTIIIALSIGLLEVIGVFLGYYLGAASATFLPAMLGFAGGAMLYLISDEMIPETHAHGYQKQATYALLIGFMTLLLMEKITF